MSANNCSVLKSTLKRKSECTKTNKIRLELFSLAQTEINEKQKLEKDCFSFSNQSFKETKERPQSKFISKKISLNSGKTANDSLDMSSDEEESSQMSCEEEEI